MASRSLSLLRSLLLPRAGEEVGAGGQQPQAPYYGWVLMVVLGITTIISYGTTQYLFGVLVVPLDATFGWGRASISGAYALGLIVAGLLGVPIGRLVDRWGARLLMSAGSALALFGLAHMAALWRCVLVWDHSRRAGCTTCCTTTTWPSGCAPLLSCRQPPASPLCLNPAHGMRPSRMRLPERMQTWSRAEGEDGEKWGMRPFGETAVSL